MTDGIVTNQNRIVKAAQTSTKQEIAMQLTSGAVSALCIPFYDITTRGKPNSQRASVMAANFIEYAYAGKRFISKITELLSEAAALNDQNNSEAAKSRCRIAAALILTALLSYGPQTIITAIDSDYSELMTIFATIASGASGTMFYGLSMLELRDFAKSNAVFLRQEISFCFRGIFSYYVPTWFSPVSEQNQQDRRDKKIILHNLNKIKNRLRFVDKTNDQMPHVEKSYSIYEFVNSCISLAESVHTRFGNPGAVTNGLRFLGGTAVMIGTVYSTEGYLCRTGAIMESLLAISATLALFCAMVMLAPQYILNMKGGFTLGDSIVDTISALINYGCFPKIDRIGGLVGTLVYVLSPLLASFIALGSGATSVALFEKSCASSPVNSDALPAKMAPASAAQWVFWMTCLFNAIYVAFAFRAANAYCVERSTSDKLANDRNYLHTFKSFDGLIQSMENLPPSEFLKRARENFESLFERLRDQNFLEEKGQYTLISRTV